ncbi:TetR/AcrR family transcriptional regulator [Ferrimonas pelagia]
MSKRREFLELVFTLEYGMKKTRDTVRRNLLQAAKRVIVQQGVIGFRFCDVAKESQVSMGSLYSHFSCKESLLVSLYIERVMRLIEVRRQIAQCQLSPYEKLIAVNLLSVMASLHHQKADGLNFLLANPSVWEQAEPSLKLQMEGGYGAMTEQTRDLWDQAVASGSLLSEPSAIAMSRHQLLCYQRGCVMQLQNPMVNKSREKPDLSLCLDTMVAILSTLAWAEGADRLDRTQLLSVCRTLVDQHEVALI